MRKYRIDQFVFHSKSRRRGQALLLSVLIMIFIVLLGTTFIAIVASNMSNTARTGSKDEARQAAKAGIEYADSQLTGSDLGLGWRPQSISPPPVVGDPAYNFYWTALDRAQGWSGAFYYEYNPATLPAPYDAKFVKYPLPEAVASGDNTSNFMIRLSQVQANELPDNADNTKTGDIRIESIGFANDDPAAYCKIVAYKTGSANNPLTAAMRSVTNWDFNANTVPEGYLTVTGPGTTTQGPTLQLSNSKGYFDPNACPFYVTISTLGNMNNSVPPQMGSVEVTAVSYTNGEPTLTISTPFTASISSATASFMVQKAANLGAPLTVNYDNANPTPVDYRISGINNPINPSLSNQPGSVWVNGGLVWFGNNLSASGIAGIQATNLLAPSAVTTTTSPASVIKVSGLFTSSILAPTPPPVATVEVSGKYKNSSGTLTTIATQLPDYSTSTLTTDQNTLFTSGLVDDGFNRLQGSLDPTRQTHSFTPPDITAGGDGFGRYRQLTRYSAPDTTHFPSATIVSSSYGYGQGIYINNPTDVEKVGSTPMTQTQLHDLWFGTGAVGTTGFERLDTPVTPASASNSLEEQHLRGWVSPDQFLPRGAEVVLNDTNPPTITVTLDARADNDSVSSSTDGYENLYSAGSIPAQPDESKMLHDEAGNVLPGVYRHTYAWPTNGTLFAEGNIRIRGKLSSYSPTNSLTVVSMNNIYIEGSLSAGSKKVLLLAKKNVIVNPTQVLEGTEVVTELSAPVSGGNSITVSDASGFQAGDYIEINDSVTRNVISVSGNTLNLDGNALGTYSTGSIVHTYFDPTITNALPATVAMRIANSTQAIVRRLHLDTATNVRLAFRHSAEYKKALTVQIDPSLDGNKMPGMRLDSAELNNKAIADNKTPVITSADKYLRVNYTQTPIAADGTLGTAQTATDTFANNLAATPYQTNTGDAADVNAADNISLGDLYKQMLDKYTDPHWDYGNATGSPPTVVGTSVQNNITHTVPTSYTSGNQWVNIDNIDNTTDVNAYHDDNSANPLTHSPAKPHPLFYFMASVGNRKDFGAADPSSYPISQTFYDRSAATSSSPFTVPMATSMWLTVNGVQATLQGNIWDTGISNFYKVLQFGFAPLFVNSDSDGNPIVTDIQDLSGNSIYPAQDYADNEDTLTSDQYFYQPYGKENITADGYGGSTYATQTKYDSDAKYTLDSRLISDPQMQAGENALVIEMDEQEIGGHPLSYYFQNHYQIPYYRLSNLKLQNETPDNSNDVTKLETGTTFDINAYVYAQEGGWYVIPGTYFDANVKNGSSVDQDLNRDGVISQGESAAAYRYHRYNYQIVFTGAIMENQTASVSDVGDWTDKWATVKLTNADFSGGSVQASGTAGTQLFYNSADPATNDFNTILYFYDPTAAQGALSTDPGFHAPVAAGLIYQG